MILLCGGPDYGAYFAGVLTLLFLFAFIRAILSSSVAARAMNQGGLSVEGVEVASAEYYQAMAEQLSTHGIKGLAASIRTLPEGGVGKPMREYLRVKKDDVIFYVCTFKLGTSQVFTYWQIAPQNFWRRFWRSIPLLGNVIIAMFMPVTLYKIDVSSALNGIIQEDLKVVTGQFSQSKGIRELNDVDYVRMNKLYSR